MKLHHDDHTITLIIRVLEECLEEEYSAEELRSRVRDMLALLIGSVNVYQHDNNGLEKARDGKRTASDFDVK
ncbi:hypothetical protein U27_01529 [Candidatus Vecturithrix granuli]|uniref:Uncharacterized protein n=1 Tax=Vecturithrix granuli TaxID=1499967 RepID=A0A081CAM3_VECG1|nr:hypothetical protein U27_01529 [Candidatus Vecturithrix granuli]